MGKGSPSRAERAARSPRECHVSAFCDSTRSVRREYYDVIGSRRDSKTHQALHAELRFQVTLYQDPLPLLGVIFLGRRWGTELGGHVWYEPRVDQALSDMNLRH